MKSTAPPLPKITMCGGKFSMKLPDNTIHEKKLK
jgi:hypothetical protein